MAFAIRPPRPMTLPTSASATWRWNLVKSPSCVSVTTTAVGSSTSALATCSSSPRMLPFETDSVLALSPLI